MTFEPYAARTHENMREVLMDPDASGPAIHYYMIRGGSAKRNVTVLETGVIGNEYPKTYGHYHIGDLDETYRFLEGEGVVLLQKLADPADPGTVAEFTAKRVSAGMSVYIPPGYGHLTVNVGDTWLVMTDDSPVAGAADNAAIPGHAEYEKVRQMRGFAYYVVSHNGAPAFVPNPRYTAVQGADFGGIPLVANV